MHQRVRSTMGGIFYLPCSRCCRGGVRVLHCSWDGSLRLIRRVVFDFEPRLGTTTGPVMPLCLLQYDGFLVFWSLPHPTRWAVFLVFTAARPARLGAPGCSVVQKHAHTAPWQCVSSAATLHWIFQNHLRGPARYVDLRTTAEGSVMQGATATSSQLEPRLLRIRHAV